ncbi:hypothetical protein J6590_090753 [Homalodisca vitripennis]|nr:hypothetical protein J6590_053044 [Homalodisca vitripennis]KAG8314540.1 hypothetical protein J6590_090752 [Homalodisca vitripennis]KAG8314541.1 hypothetical protein J6590_090753 [Homalodisca vitripennis]
MQTTPVIWSHVRKEIQRKSTTRSSKPLGTDSCRDPIRKDSGLYLSHVTLKEGKAISVPASPAGRVQHPLMFRQSSFTVLKPLLCTSKTYRSTYEPQYLRSSWISKWIAQETYFFS